MKLLLASASPRRKTLLKELFPHFEVRPADIEEVALPGETPLRCAERLAMEKALKARETSKEGFILAADTLVTINGAVFGKPKDPIEAEEMLKTLMGKTHSVITAFCIIEAKSGKALVRSVESRVTIKNLSQEEISAYIESKEPFDKAGAYAVQGGTHAKRRGSGGMFVEKVEGSYTNVVGLPMDEVRESFEKLGVII